jgi:hypothetical protein
LKDTEIFSFIKDKAYMTFFRVKPGKIKNSEFFIRLLGHPEPLLLVRNSTKYHKSPDKQQRLPPPACPPESRDPPIVICP